MNQHGRLRVPKARTDWLTKDGFCQAIEALTVASARRPGMQNRWWQAWSDGHDNRKLRLFILPMSAILTLSTLCISINFIRAGCVHFLHFRDIRAMLAGRGWTMPGTMLGAGSVLQIAAGVGLLWQPARFISASALLAFTVIANVTLVDFWRRSGHERVAASNAFFSNVAVCGGLLLALTT
jgi:uncharacterized membrane protein YphA (DoxX/SURF4 family)